MSSLIQIENVTKCHRRNESEVHALRGISTTIESGSFTFILGPSGSGKSTLLYLLGSLDEPTTGNILVDHRNLREMTESEKDKYRQFEVGFVFQNFNLITNLTAWENVLVPFLPMGIRKEQQVKALNMLARVGLKDRAEHHPHQLSGGEQQRVAIARALFKQPSLILADEPTGELDSETGSIVFEHLRELHRSHQATVIVVTHDPSYITEEDHILRLKDGYLET